MKERTDFGTAYRKILKLLDSGEPYTLNKLSREAKINFRTVKKALNILESTQSSLSDKHLDIFALDNLTVVRMREKGWTSLSKKIQHMIIRANHYPTASREEEVLVYLFQKKAVTEHAAVEIPQDEILTGLIEAEHIDKINGRFYLTKEGTYVAKGALILYPELESASLRPAVVKTKSKTQGQTL